MFSDLRSLNMKESENHVFRFVPYRMYQCRERRDAQERPCSEQVRDGLIQSFL